MREGQWSEGEDGGAREGQKKGAVKLCKLERANW